MFSLSQEAKFSCVLNHRKLVDRTTENFCRQIVSDAEISISDAEIRVSAAEMRISAAEIGVSAAIIGVFAVITCVSAAITIPLHRRIHPVLQTSPPADRCIFGWPAPVLHVVAV